jgi:hypothetical protein
MLPVSLAMMFLVKFPLWMAMLTFLPMYIFVLALFIQLAGLHEFLKAHGRKWSWKDACVMLLAFFPYQILLGIGAIRAVYRHLKGTKDWEKTAHIGQHLQKA